MNTTGDYRDKLKRLGCLSFEILKEEWNYYELEDGTLLSVKTVLINVFKEGVDEKGRPIYSFSWTNIIGAVSPPQLRGPPSRKRYTPEELEDSIDKEELKFTPLKEGWSEYRLEDKTRLFIKPILVEVSRTKKYDSRGTPIYITNIQPIVKVKLRRK